MLLFTFKIMQHIQGYRMHFRGRFLRPEFPAVYILQSESSNYIATDLGNVIVASTGFKPCTAKLYSAAASA